MRCRPARFAPMAMLGACALTLGGVAAAAADLEAGVAVVDITPPLGYRMSGYFHERLATGVRDPLHAKALVLRQGSERLALVFCDLIGLCLDVSARARKRASEATGIPAAHILLAATHTHTGPLYFGALRKHFHDLAVAKRGQDPHETTDYPARLVEKIVEAITTANAALRPARLEAGTATQSGLSFNRRFHMKDGTVRFNPGVLNPEIVRPAGPIDPAVGIVLVRDAASGPPRAAVVNFALHLDTVGGTRYAADYPHFLERSLRETFGKSFVVFFGTGACGDINHIDVTRKERLKTEQIGRTLAATVRAAVARLEAVGPALAARSTIVRAPLQRYRGEQIAQARQKMALVASRKLAFLQRVEAYKIVALQWRGGTSIPLEVQVFRLGRRVAIVGLPGEVFVELGLAIRRASPFPATLVIELCHDAPGYIPTRRAFAEGSYETVNSRIQPGWGERLAEAASRLLGQLYNADP